MTAEHKSSFANIEKTSRPTVQKTTCVCSGFRGKQPKVRGALLTAFAKGSRAAFALLTLAQLGVVRTDCIPRAVLQSDWSTIIVAEYTGRGYLSGGGSERGRTHTHTHTHTQTENNNPCLHMRGEGKRVCCTAYF